MVGPTLIFPYPDEFSYEVSGKVEAIAYPERCHPKPYAQKRNKNGIKDRGPDMRIFTTMVGCHRQRLD